LVTATLMAETAPRYLSGEITAISGVLRDGAQHS
jgi:hypothetical protein